MTGIYPIPVWSWSPDRRFSALEIGADPLIREVWLRDRSEDRDVCEGVAGAPALERRAAGGAPPLEGRG